MNNEYLKTRIKKEPCFENGVVSRYTAEVQICNVWFRIGDLGISFLGYDLLRCEQTFNRRVLTVSDPLLRACITAEYKLNQWAVQCSEDKAKECIDMFRSIVEELLREWGCFKENESIQQQHFETEYKDYP